MSAVSPYTGWTRASWAEYADRLLLSVRPHASPSGALIRFPGTPGGYGTAIDGLEGFARTFLLAGFRIAGSAGHDPLGLLERCALGLAAGTDPASPERWTTPREHSQAKVEAASIALILDLTRPWLWDQLSQGVQERVVAYLTQVVGDPGYPRTNWVWFRLVVEQFLASVGGPWSPGDVENDLATHESFSRDGGWYSDGAQRSFDHYAGWALHFYPFLWSRMTGASQRAAPLLPAWRERLNRYLHDAVRLVGADGSPLIQGRSLIYRFAAAAPFWIAALDGTTSLPPGLLRRAASGIVAHFADRGVPDDGGLLTVGWWHPWQRLAQCYSGTGSPYWAAKGMLGLALPADHPVWTDVELPLPVEQRDQLVVIAAPGWAVSGTKADGIVRVYNHGTDHASPGDRVGDSPLYARFGYSTATAPLLDEPGWDSPLDQSVVLLDAAGNASHRTGFTTLSTLVSDGVAILASAARAHWVTPDRSAANHGSGRPGSAVDVATITTVSICYGVWEVRLVHLDPAAAPGWHEVAELRIGGWPITAAEPPAATARQAEATIQGRLSSAAVGLVGITGAGVHQAKDATPLGTWTATPWLSAVPQPETWTVAALALSGGQQAPQPPLTRVSGPADAAHVHITWPDGAVTKAALPAPPALHRSERRD